MLGTINEQVPNFRLLGSSNLITAKIEVDLSEHGSILTERDEAPVTVVGIENEHDVEEAARALRSGAKCVLVCKRHDLDFQAVSKNRNLLFIIVETAEDFNRLSSRFSETTLPRVFVWNMCGDWPATFVTEQIHKRLM